MRSEKTLANFRAGRRASKYSYNVNIDDGNDMMENKLRRRIGYDCNRLKLRVLDEYGPAYIREHWADKAMRSLGVPSTDSSFAGYSL
ncbi:hypothetical protein BDA99DRAFT_565474 [Phascolomyces articulosus]|uniref:Uncharacterized protein n=1 Tax=Phascolomyces articulosus TaxID=60185 RepID=A0AAD5K159_9FUNG|nr:hypothetical protein BDA99DRAFT_565474 [Phascolomyces articulosus]